MSWGGAPPNPPPLGAVSVPPPPLRLPLPMTSFATVFGSLSPLYPTPLTVSRTPRRRPTRDVHAPVDSLGRHAARTGPTLGASLRTSALTPPPPPLSPLSLPPPPCRTQTSP